MKLTSYDHDHDHDHGMGGGGEKGETPILFGGTFRCKKHRPGFKIRHPLLLKNAGKNHPKMEVWSR